MVDNFGRSKVLFVFFFPTNVIHVKDRRLGFKLTDTE